jgi:hypothetical protein
LQKNLDKAGNSCEILSVSFEKIPEKRGDFSFLGFPHFQTGVPSGLPVELE